MTAAPIDMVIPATDKPIDDLITAAYASSDMVNAMHYALQEAVMPLQRRVAMMVVDCHVRNAMIAGRA